MRLGKNCINNCDFTSYAISEEIDEKVTENGLILEPIAVGFSGGSQHTALTIKNADNEEIILDYTMRQFDNNADFPTILTKEQWHNKVNEKVKEKYNIEIIGYYQDGYSSMPLIPL